MEIILLDNVKGKGKKGDLITVANGYGNFLITKNLAVLANEANKEILEEQKEQEAIEAAKHLEEMKELKKIIDAKTVRVKVKPGKDGRIFGSVSTKQICDIFFNETKIKLDKKKIKSTLPINSLGVYKLEVELHKEVTATLNVKVEE